MGNEWSCEAGVSQLMQLPPEPGGAEAVLVALEPRGPAMAISGFKVNENTRE